MDANGTSYPRKGLYLIATLPMIGLYGVIAAFLWTVGIAPFAVYVALFVVVAVAQSYVCVYYQCPYVGRFAPCLGGFCLPASRIALLWKNAPRSESIYNVAVSAAFLAFAGIIFFPAYFLYRQDALYLLVYFVVVMAYAAVFLGWICPVCAIRHLCPGGRTSTDVRKLFTGKSA